MRKDDREGNFTGERMRNTLQRHCNKWCEERKKWIIQLKVSRVVSGMTTQFERSEFKLSLAGADEAG